MKKVFAIILTAILVLCAVPLSVSAAGSTVVYVSSDCFGDGSTPERACNNLVDAFNALDLTKDCTVVFVGPYKQTAHFNFGEEWKKITFTTTYGGVDYAATEDAVYSTGAFRFFQYGELVFDNFNFEMTGAFWLLVCQNHPFTATSTFKMECTNAACNGKAFGTAFGVLMGYQNGMGDSVDDEYNEPNKVELYAGKNVLVTAGNRQLRDCNNSGKQEIILGGNVEVGNLYMASVNVAGLSNGDIDITVKDNALVKMINGPLDSGCTINSVTVNWLGGSIEAGAIVNAAAYNPEQVDANATITNGSLLKYSAAAEKAASFATISALFDKTEKLGDAPTTTEAPTTTLAPQTAPAETTVHVDEPTPQTGDMSFALILAGAAAVAVAAVAVIRRKEEN